mgnify:CR=1 FL=1
MNNKTWTWMAGSKVADQPGVYGEKGNGNSSTTPGAREYAGVWYDNSKQEFWMYGGFGIGEESEEGTK